MATDLNAGLSRLSHQPLDESYRRSLTFNNSLEAYPDQKPKPLEGEQQTLHPGDNYFDIVKIERHDALYEEQAHQPTPVPTRDKAIRLVPAVFPRVSGPAQRGDHSFGSTEEHVDSMEQHVDSTEDHVDLTEEYVVVSPPSIAAILQDLSEPISTWRSTNSVTQRPLQHALDVVRIRGLATSSSSGSFYTRKFAYRGLQGARDFRLVTVLPKRTNFELTCELIHCSLSDPPEYIAISYAWGDGFDKKDIILGGDKHFTVNNSLHGALMAVREMERSILVWIDGLSIDQGNQAERATQVQMMDQIYAKATSVAIWLGSETDDSRIATRLVSELKWENDAKKWIKSIDHDGRTVLRSLFKRDYWKRLWVVQEVYHARSKTVYCGSSKLQWTIYKKASDALWQHESDSYLWTGPSSFPDIERLLALGPNSLLGVLRACRKKLSENPRDKIFGILGILPNDVRERLHVGYDKSVKSLYLDVTQLIISSTRRLDVIREAIHFPVQVSFTDLPTWCPNWAQVPENSALSSGNFSAAGNSDAQYEFKDGLRKLEVSAVELGVVHTTGVAVGTLCSLQDYLMAFLNWRTHLISFFNVPEGEEAHHQSVKDFCQTLALGQLIEGKEQYWAEVCYQVFSSLIQERLPRFQLDGEFQRHGEPGILQKHELRSFIQKHFGDRMMGRTFCLTRDGLMGMGTGFMSREDIVVVPFGCSTPVLLRAEGQRNEFRYVGDVYIHGYMHGEALTSDKLVKRYILH